MLVGDPVPLALVDMKNFVRLVQFAWPYRLRFGLSIGCALMVALFYFTELGAVLPLLKILINKDSPQRWISAKLDSIDENLERLGAQRQELQRVEDELEAEGPGGTRLSEHFRELRDQVSQIDDDVKAHQLRRDLPGVHGQPPTSADPHQCARRSA